MQFVFSALWGRASDRYGRKPIMLICLLGTSSSYVLFALADSLFLLFLSRLFAGMLGGSFVIGQACVADRTTPERRTRGMGMLGMAFGLGFIFGPAIGGFLSAWGYMLPGLAAAGFSFTAAVIAFRWLPESFPVELRAEPGARPGWRAGLGERAGEIRRVLSQPAVRNPITAAFLGTIGFAAFTATFPLYLRAPLGLTPASAGGWFAFTGMVSAAVQGGLIGPLVDRIGERRVAMIGAMLAGAGLALLGVASNPWGLAAVLACIGGGWGLMNPSLVGLVSKAGGVMQGGVLGVLQSAASMARVVGPLAGGWAFGALGHRTEFAIAGAIMLATAFYVARLCVDPEAMLQSLGAGGSTAAGNGVAGVS
jgi:DHA1 family tetracycline resistance protein-like MFS transporter